MSEDLQERPALCDTPGISKGPGSMHAKHCGPDTPKPTEKAKPDIRSKSLTDTKKKRDTLKSLGLTHENKKTYKEFVNNVSEVFNVGKMSDKKLRDFISSFDMDSKMGAAAAMQLRAAKKEASRRRLKEDDESWTIEANLNDYVKKFQMKMGDKTSAVDKDAWVDGIGGLTKRERKTLKRTLQVHTKEGLRKFEDLKQQDEIAPLVAAGLGLAGRAALGLAKGAMRGAGRVGTAGAGFGLGQAANAIAKTPAVIGKAVAGGVAAGATKAAIDHHLTKKREAEAKKKKEVNSLNQEDTVNEVDSSGIDMYDNKRKESERRKKARETPSSPETQAKLKRARAGEVVDELSKGLLNRAANTARDQAGYQRHVSQTADTNLDRKRAGYKAATKDYQAFKFGVAARKKERDAKEDYESRDKDFEKLGPRSKSEMIPKKPPRYSGKSGTKEDKKGIGESTKEYAKSLEKIANDKALKMLSKSERSNLLKIRDLLAKERREEVEPVDEGRLGAVAGAIAGGLSGGPAGAVAGAVGGHIAQNVAGHVVGKASRSILKHMAKKKEKDLRKYDDHNRHADAKRENVEPVDEILPAIAAIGGAIGGAAKAAVATPIRRAVTKTVAKKIHKKVTEPPPSTDEGRIVNEGKDLQAKMALGDAKIKFKVEDGKLYVDKKDVMKAEKALAKSFKTKPSSLDGKKFPAVYYHGGSLGIWNKKRAITGG